MAKGSVQRKGTVWSFVVDLGPDPATGRRRRARRSGFATKRGAESALRALSTASNNEPAVTCDRSTVSGFLTEWLETMRPRIRETTWVSYEMAANRITRHYWRPLERLLVNCHRGRSDGSGRTARSRCAHVCEQIVARREEGACGGSSGIPKQASAIASRSQPMMRRAMEPATSGCRNRMAPRPSDSSTATCLARFIHRRSPMLHA